MKSRRKTSTFSNSEKERKSSGFRKGSKSRGIMKEDAKCRTEINVNLILNHIRDKETMTYILDNKHFDFYVNLFRKYFKVFNPTTHQKTTMVQVQQIMSYFSSDILFTKQLCQDSLKVCKQILFCNWKFLLKNFKFICFEFKNYTGYNCLSFIHMQYIYLLNDDIVHLYKAMFHYCEKTVLVPDQIRILMTFYIMCPLNQKGKKDFAKKFFFEKFLKNSDLDFYFEFLTKLIEPFNKVKKLKGFHDLFSTDCIVKLNQGYGQVITLQFTSYDLFRRILFFLEMFPEGKNFKFMDKDISTGLLKNLESFYINMVVNFPKEPRLNQTMDCGIKQTKVNVFTVFFLLDKVFKEFSIANKHKGFTQALAVLQVYQRFNNKKMFSHKISDYLYKIFNTSDGIADEKPEYLAFLNYFQMFLMRNYGIVKFNHLTDILAKSASYALTFDNKTRHIPLSILNLVKYNPLDSHQFLITFLKYFNHFEDKQFVCLLNEILVLSDVDLHQFTSMRVDCDLNSGIFFLKNREIIKEIPLEYDNKLLEHLLVQLSYLPEEKNLKRILENFQKIILSRFSLEYLLKGAFDHDIISFSKIIVLLMKFKFISKKKLDSIEWVSFENDKFKKEGMIQLIDNLITLLARDNSRKYIDLERIFEENCDKRLTSFSKDTPKFRYLSLEDGKTSQKMIVCDQNSRSISQWDIESLELEFQEPKKTEKSTSDEEQPNILDSVQEESAQKFDMTIEEETDDETVLSSPPNFEDIFDDWVEEEKSHQPRVSEEIFQINTLNRDGFIIDRDDFNLSLFPTLTDFKIPLNNRESIEDHLGFLRSHALIVPILTTKDIEEEETANFIKSLGCLIEYNPIKNKNGVSISKVIESVTHDFVYFLTNSLDEISMLKKVTMKGKNRKSIELSKTLILYSDENETEKWIPLILKLDCFTLLGNILRTWEVNTLSLSFIKILSKNQKSEIFGVVGQKNLVNVSLIGKRMAKMLSRKHLVSKNYSQDHELALIKSS